MRTFLLLLAGLILTNAGLSQSARQVGLRDNTPSVFAFTNATIYTAPGLTIDRATLVVRNGMIEALGREVSIPADAKVIDVTGKTIYPGFIDGYADMGLSEPSDHEVTNQAHWSPQVRTFYQVADAFRYDEQAASVMRSQGFVLAHVVPRHGIFAGQGALVTLADNDKSKLLVAKGTSQAFSLERSSAFGRGYPQSVMGAFSMIRQTLYDAKWYARAHARHLQKQHILARPEINPALGILADDLSNSKPFIMEIPDEQWIDRASRLAAEFDLNLWLVASGYEYRRPMSDEGKRHPFIVPLNFPEAPDVSSPEASMQLSLEELRHWHLGPTNPAELASQYISMALSANGMKDKGSFLQNLRTAVDRGLSETDALAALTTTPARLLGIDDQYGSLEKGKAASFIVADGNLFQKGHDIEQIWIDGRLYQVKPDRPDPRGEWQVLSPPELEGMVLKIEGDMNRLRGSLADEQQQGQLSTVKYDSQRLSFHIAGDSLQLEHGYRMSASLTKNELLGLAENSQGTFVSWRAVRTKSYQPDNKQSDQQTNDIIDIPTRIPSLDYGFNKLPERPHHVVIRNATIWTQGHQGIMEGADMLVSQGRIVEVGHGLSAPASAVEVDATGMHVTPGLIDPHLHTSITGNVNETASAITSETRILDVIDANNVWIYRLLAGGLTTANLFHGSANPIGGQSAVIKMRWGGLPDDLWVKDAMPGLKFALGENVKRTPGRYPNTRMGTAQIIEDSFLAALQYEKDKTASQGRRRRDAKPFRKDLQLEPILEVLQGKRLAHVHAYRQDEMLMIMRLAEKYGFTVASFEHTVEGYKIADELRDHGAAAIIWTDWSSFKVEAYDGIHQNARLLLDAGVLTSLHSDNTQLATRMNWEAGKVLRSGISEEDAMNLLTLNPAKIIRLDHRIGSLEPGKDGDFVIWNGHPLSSLTTADQTWIEGRKYFDKEDDQELQQQVKKERALIIRQIIDSKQITSSD